MRYAVVQLELAPLPADALRRAFAQSQSLRAQDAAVAARDASGILARALSQHDALTISGCLNEMGIATEAVAQDALSKLPPAKLTSRIDCLEAGMVLYDALGRRRLVDWAIVDFLSVGQVGMVDLIRQDPQYFPTQASDNYALVRSNSRYTEKTCQHLLLDILIAGPQRYRADATKLN